MPTPSDDQLYQATLRAMRIVIVVLLVGVSLMLVVAFTVIRAGRWFAPEPWRLTLPLGTMALGTAVVAAVLSFILPGLQASSLIRKMDRPSTYDGSEGPYQRPETETGRLLEIARESMIVGVGLLEGAAFFNAIAYLLEGGAIPLITCLLLVGLIASKYPTRFGLENWVDERRTSPR